MFAKTVVTFASLLAAASGKSARLPVASLSASRLSTAN